MIEQNVNSEFFIIEINMKVMNFTKKKVIYNYLKSKNIKIKYNEKDGNYYDKYFGSYHEDIKDKYLSKRDKYLSQKDKKFLVTVFSDKNYCDFIFNYFRSSKKCYEFMKSFFELEKKFKLRSLNLKNLNYKFLRIVFNNLFLNTKIFNYSFYYLQIMPFILKFYKIYLFKLINLKKQFKKYNNLYDLKFSRIKKKNKNLNN